MTQLTHGGDWAGYRAQYGHDALDFSANGSPLGLPQGVANAIAAALPHADRYPDPLCRALRAKLAPHEGIPAESILCSNGAADLIFRLAWAAKPRTALVTAPTFAEYAAALESAGCAVRRHFLQAEVDFAVTDSILSSITPEVDMVFLCQPNNPTGQLTLLPLVERILRRCEACGALLVVGFVVQVALQAVLNIAVVTNTIPNTGISLPFFSSGGTSLMMLLGEMGIVLSVSRGET